ncbi:MAG: hypothetical protein RIA63_05255, partial [Cyclobacteriaceae bacterium]
MEHLKYCLSEIVSVRALLEIKNSSFYKRCLARYVAIRVDDFIKLAFSLNKATVNLKSIKDDLNALQDLYKEYFKLQRDKYGAHFQELEFSQRLEIWSLIDFERANFFILEPSEIYSKFHSIVGFENIASLGCIILPSAKTQVENLNASMDIEKYPNFSSDVLSLTRYNSGGLIHCSQVQIKAGVLKSLEIILDYEIAIFHALETQENFANILKKLIITDLVSYYDNFITRMDLLPEAPQEEDGLDSLITLSNFPIAHNILLDFKTNFKYSESLGSLRHIRNKVCGHIDRNIPVAELNQILKSLSIETIEGFYNQIQKTFKKVCNEELVFHTFRLDPKEKIHGVTRFHGIPARPFDNDSIPIIEFLSKDVNDIQEYDRFFSLLSKQDSYEEARHYFWECFSTSDLIEHVEFKFNQKGFQRSERLEIRKIYLYFKEKLGDQAYLTEDKVKIINLFTACKSGYPNTLLYILHETYAMNKSNY